jgi:hypothetical protein
MAQLLAQAALIGLASGLVLSAGGLAIALTARRSYVSRRRPTRLLTLTTRRSPEEVRAGVTSLASYELVEDLPDRRLITLKSRPTLFSWGFFFPIYLDSQPNATTQVTVGIESRAFQMAGPVVIHHHKRCLEALRQRLDSP